MLIFSGKKSKTKREQIEEIVLEKYNQYYRLAYSYVHNEADAGDIVQNGAYKALRSCDTLKNAEYAETWVYRIMLNETFNFLKQSRVLSYDAICEEQGSVGEASEDRYENLDLKKALDALPMKDKAIIIMKYFEDKKLEEIADILDENLSTIKSRLYRSIKKLRVMLADE